MIILGIRCSSKDFTFSIISGKQESPNFIEEGTIKFPTGHNDSEKLNWFYQEIGGLIAKHSIGGIGIKGVEPMAMKGKSYGMRMQTEGMIYLQAAQKGIKYIKTKVKSTIAKDFGFKGKGKYLSTKVDYSKIENFDKKSQNTQESIQVALSMLK
jgi:Holliday junction resolvasome RuvABC endonuclease subunit